MIDSAHFDFTGFALGFTLAAIFAIVSYRLKALSVSGAIGTFIVGLVVFGFGGWLYAVPLLFFFISSSLLSRFKSEIKTRSQKTIEKAGARDIYQVFANGGVATLCILVGAITSDSRWSYIYLGSLGAAAADTWATEIGTLLSGKPRSIVSLKRVSPGESGGISIPGTLASLVGSAATVFSAFAFIVNDIEIELLIYAIAAGFIGSLIDSVLGATVQAGHKCFKCGANVETLYHCNEKTKLVRGVGFINNDAVNIISNLIASVFLMALIFRLI